MDTVTAAPRQIFTNCLLQVNNIISEFMGFPGWARAALEILQEHQLGKRQNHKDLLGAHNMALLHNGRTR